MTGGAIETIDQHDGNRISAGKCKSKLFSIKKLRLSLKYRPKLLNLILNLRRKVQKKNKLISDFRHKLKLLEPKASTKHASAQTDCESENNPLQSVELHKPESTEISQKLSEDVKEPSKNSLDWNIDSKNGNNEKSIAEQVKEAAQSALDQNGMVYVESAGMYYDYKTGYYYNSELGLYYHTDTNCYYYYSDEKQTFVFHSYPDTSKMLAATEALKRHEKRKAKKHKQEKQDEDASKNKKQKTKDDKVKCRKEKRQTKSKKTLKESKDFPKEKEEDKVLKLVEEDASEKITEAKKDDLEDGECSESGDDDVVAVIDGDEGSESSDEESRANSSTASEDDDDSVARHHPPCMRVMVKATDLPKLKVGSLYLVTKDGGTVGREGDHHTILLKDQNVSRNHLDIKYDTSRRVYTAMDLGSKNGTVLNGQRMSDSQVPSPAVEIPHGSMLQLGETKLLCHIHQGNDTCGHCEPGLVMAADDQDKKVAYTRICSVQKQHAMELARLKNKYAPEPLAIEDGSYNDRAKARRDTVGSSHAAEKTQQSDLDTFIAEDNKGFKLLSKMGWSKGEGLGKESQGHTEPIPLVSNETKAGLGAHGSAAPVTVGCVGCVGSVPLRLSRRSRALRPPAKLFRDPLEEDDD